MMIITIMMMATMRIMVAVVMILVVVVIKMMVRLGTVAHTCHPNTLRGQGGQITRSRDRDYPGQHSETPSLLKYKN